MRHVVLLPTYNEKDNVEQIIPEILSALPFAHVLVIDDNSPDGTAAIVERMIKTNDRLHVLKRPGKQGLGMAYKDAITQVLKDPQLEVVITMDADGSHDPSYLPAMLTALDTHDLAVGSRYVKGGGIENWERWRYWLSKYGNIYSRFLTGAGVNDLTAGFVAVRRSVLESMRFEQLAASGYAYQIEFKFHAVQHAKARVIEVPIIFRSRREGESKISRHIVREGLKTPIRLFFKRFTS